VIGRFILLLCGSFGVAAAHDPITTRLTWSKEISRIVYKRCGGCHRTGANVALINYADARPWAKAIRYEVLRRRMPPWGAIKGFRPLRDDPSLTQEEITRIAAWVEGGAPEGDPKYLPEAPMAGAASPIPAAASVELSHRLNRRVVLAGIQPLGAVEEAKITATLPDGRVEPLLWLHGYKAEWKHPFLFEEPIVLPPGTRINMPPGTPVRGIISAPKPKR
jgi:hypothetical protein